MYAPGATSRRLMAACSHAMPKAFHAKYHYKRVYDLEPYITVKRLADGVRLRPYKYWGIWEYPHGTVRQSACCYTIAEGIWDERPIFTAVLAIFWEDQRYPFGMIHNYRPIFPGQRQVMQLALSDLP